MLSEVKLVRVCEWRRGGTTRQTLGARLPKKMVVVDGKVVVNGKGGGWGIHDCG